MLTLSIHSVKGFQGHRRSGLGRLRYRFEIKKMLILLKDVVLNDDSHLCK